MTRIDAHNHLQSPLLAPHWPAIRIELESRRVAYCVVNGTHEGDWDGVANLARNNPRVVPSFGVHPWHAPKRSPEWRERLIAATEAVPSAIGEIGLDRWIEGNDPADQEALFAEQLRIAAERNLPVTVHCLRAWGKLLEILQRERRPECGFLIHAYGGPAEMVAPFARLGAYFSFSAYFAHDRKAKQREVFRSIPRERLLIETDAPDMAPPETVAVVPLRDSDGGFINHPANIEAGYCLAAALLEEAEDDLAAQVECNFQRLFGGVLRPGAALDGTPD